jgi:hypothetical protein
LHLDGEGLTGVFIETFALVAVPMSGDEPMPRPDLHGLRVDAEQARRFVQREHALLAQTLVARSEPVVAPDTFDALSFAITWSDSLGDLSGSSDGPKSHRLDRISTSGGDYWPHRGSVRFSVRRRTVGGKNGWDDVRSWLWAFPPSAGLRRAAGVAMMETTDFGNLGNRQL